MNCLRLFLVLQSCLLPSWCYSVEPEGQDPPLRLALSFTLNLKTSKIIENDLAVRNLKDRSLFQTGSQRIRLSLQDVLDSVRRQSPQAVLSRLEREAQKRTSEAALTLFQPKQTISTTFSAEQPFSSSVERQKTKNLVLQSSWQLPWGTSASLSFRRPFGYSRPGVDEQSIALEVKQAILKGNWSVSSMERDSLLLEDRLADVQYILQQRNLSLQAVEAYFSLYQAQQELDISLRALSRAKERLKISRTLFDTGKIAKLDLRQAEADESIAESTQESAVQAVKEASRVLSLVLGEDLLAELVLETPELLSHNSLPSIEDALLSALKNRPELVESSIAVVAQEQALVRAKNSLLPRLDISFQSERALGRGSSGNTSQPGSNVNSSVGVIIEVPLSRIELNAAVDSAKIALERTKLSDLERRRTIKSEVYARYDGLWAANRRLKLATETLRLQESILGGEEEKLRAGRLSSSSFTFVQENLLDAERARLDAQIELVRAKFLFDLALGIDPK